MISLTRLAPWMIPHRWRFAAGLLCVVVSTALYSLIPTLLGVTLVMAFFRFYNA